jgi:dihydroorotase
MLDSRGWIPQVHDARARGVCFDVGHGCGSFSWETAQRGFEHHFYPDTISTDLHRYNVAAPFHLTLPDVMSRFLCLGMSLYDTVLKTTAAPARVLGRQQEIGTLRPGALGDVFVFHTPEGEFPFLDTLLQTRVGSKKIEPTATIRAGRIHLPGSVKRPIRPLYECDRAVFDAVGFPFEKAQ